MLYHQYSHTFYRHVLLTGPSQVVTSTPTVHTAEAVTLHLQVPPHLLDLKAKVLIFFPACTLVAVKAAGDNSVTLLAADLS